MNSFSFVLTLATVGVASAGLIAPGYLASPWAAAGIALPAGHGIEGRWIPDINEKLFDDGSYRPQARAVPLSPSPYGLTPSGSGLEGAYVHDITEKLYDDGSYKPQLNSIPLSPSPYGLTPSGSGLEGAYVPDITEKLFDDGSYKPLIHEKLGTIVNVL